MSSLNFPAMIGEAISGKKGGRGPVIDVRSGSEDRDEDEAA